VLDDIDMSKNEGLAAGAKELDAKDDPEWMNANATDGEVGRYNCVYGTS
jgi:hypothetical protein